jgi:hypothetical protein
MTRDAPKVFPYLPPRVNESIASRIRSELESGLEVVAPFVVYSEVFGLRSVWITFRSDPGNAFCPDAKPLAHYR